MKKPLSVWLYGELAGYLNQNEEGKLHFEYSENAKYRLSLSLPQDKKEYVGKECAGFFNGLLPEGEQVRKSIAKKYGINYKNDFSLLSKIGYDCAGAVSFVYEKEEMPEFFEIKGKVLSEDELKKHILELPKKPLGMNNGEIRLSLAGAQDKTAVLVIDDKIALADKNIPTTHILKPEILGIDESVENEYICLITAKKAGIKVPKVEIRRAGDIKYFLIKRYDREILDGKFKRIHQEDFSQALNIASAFKYQSEGGADYKKCFEILRQTSAPAVSIVEFLNIMIFNFLIGNNDAHGKNFSILHHKNGKIEFAPAYDILCTQAYSGLSKKMAMKIGGHYEPEKILPEHFEKFCNEVGINAGQFQKMIEKQAFLLPKLVEETILEFENKIGKKILNVVEKNCERTIKRFGF